VLATPLSQPAPAPRPERRTSFGVYVHFPFCLTKCPYCDFLSIPERPEAIPHAAYADAVLAELEQRADAVRGRRMHSVFFGGGTPSLWDSAELGRVLARLRALFEEVEGGAEITAECNPGSFDARVAEGLFRVGVNRVSLGVQSLSGERLAFLGRRHDADEALDALDVARAAGFDNISADFIFGVAGQTPADAEREALAIAARGVSHLSAYALTIEPGTQFGELRRRGRLPLLPDESVAESFDAIRQALATHGLDHYEISNYAKPGRMARHNLGYWRGEPYLGLGLGAWGTLARAAGKLRYRNTPSLERYLGLWKSDAEPALDREGPLVAVVEPIPADVDLSERLMLGLRLDEGVDLTALEAETGALVHTRDRQRALRKWLDRGALELHGGRLRLAKTHWLLADAVIRELL
jgi:putative oxygen-independent coproporphyrinogen III oxidase